MKKIISKMLFLLLVLFSICVKAQQFTNYTTADGMPADNVNGIAIDSFNHKWFGTQGGVAMFNDTIWKTYTTANGLTDNYITCMAVDIHDGVWAGTEMGLNQFDGSVWTSYTMADGLPSNTINYLAGDPDGSIWIGTNAGISHFNGQTWVNYTTVEGLPNNMISYITPDSHGNIWIGTWLGGLSKFDGINFINYTVADSLPDNNILAISIGEENSKWIGTFNGVGVFDSLGQWQKTYRSSDGLMNNYIQDIVMDSKGTMWFGIYDTYTQDGGISKFFNSTWKSYTVTDGLVDGLVRRIAVDKKDNIWIATGNGVSKFTDSSQGFQEINGIYLSIYPNPVNRVLHIDGLSVPGTLHIFTIEGKEMMTHDLITGSNTISLPHLQPGLCIINIRTNQDVFTGKLIIR